MKSIQNILQTEGIEFMDSLMNDYLTVYEKLNASTLSFRRLGDELKFYKGRNNEEITPLNETLYSYFKDGIEFIRRVSLIFYMEFPEGWLFRMQYFNNNSHNLVEYKNMPKNNLVLSCIDTGNSVIEDQTVLAKWAERLQIDVTEPVFSGFLSEFQKESLMDYVNGKCECKVPFSQYIIGLLNPSVSHSAFSDTFNTVIDSFIFKFYKAGSKKCIAVKLVDPYMDQMLKQNMDKFGDNSGTENEIILANFVAWLQTVDMKSIDIKGDTDDERYLDLLCKLFNMYISKEMKLFKDMKSGVNESHMVNIDNIKNKETADILKNNPHLSTVFQMIVGSFMNTKDAVSGSSIMDDTLREVFNKEVKSIKRLTDCKDKQVKSFTELMKSNLNNVEKSAEESKDEKVMSFSELMDKIGSHSENGHEHDSGSDDKRENEELHEHSGKQESEEKTPENNENDSDNKESENKNTEKGSDGNGESGKNEYHEENENSENEKDSGNGDDGKPEESDNDEKPNDENSEKSEKSENEDEKDSDKNKDKEDESESDEKKTDEDDANPDEDKKDDDSEHNGDGLDKDENETDKNEDNAESGHEDDERHDDEKHDDEKHDDSRKPDNDEKPSDGKPDDNGDGKPEQNNDEQKTIDKKDNPKSSPVPKKSEESEHPEPKPEKPEKPEKKKPEHEKPQNNKPGGGDDKPSLL